MNLHIKKLVLLASCITLNATAMFTAMLNEPVAKAWCRNMADKVSEFDNAVNDAWQNNRAIAVAWCWNMANKVSKFDNAVNDAWQNSKAIAKVWCRNMADKVSEFENAVNDAGQKNKAIAVDIANNVSHAVSDAWQNSKAIAVDIANKASNAVNDAWQNKDAIFADVTNEALVMTAMAAAGLYVGHLHCKAFALDRKNRAYRIEWFRDECQAAYMLDCIHLANAQKCNDFGGWELRAEDLKSAFDDIQLTKFTCGDLESNMKFVIETMQREFLNAKKVIAEWQQSGGLTSIHLPRCYADGLTLKESLKAVKTV